jgi:hypothetical protein
MVHLPGCLLLSLHTQQTLAWVCAAPQPAVHPCQQQQWQQQHQHQQQQLGCTRDQRQQQSKQASSLAAAAPAGSVTARELLTCPPAPAAGKPKQQTSSIKRVQIRQPSSEHCPVRLLLTLMWGL